MIFDFGRQGDTAYAVMELLEGETLRARIAHGALASRKAVELAVQIADGLAAAHEKGTGVFSRRRMTTDAVIW